MKYRLVKTSSWWTNLYNTGRPQFLYYDFDLDHFEVAGYPVARNYKWEFNKEEIDLMQKEFNLNEFLIEKVREGENIDGV